MTSQHKIILVGCGKMGSALLDAWIKSDIDAQFSVIEPNDITIQTVEHFKSADSASSALNSATTIILAVKPQAMPQICADLKPHISDDALILSIAAGQSIANFESYFSSTQPIIRAMPNTPASIGKGMSVAVANNNTNEDHKAIATKLLSAAGKCEWVDDESLMNAVTALSGSGPAYIFLLIESLASAGEKLGLSKDMAMSLARQTVIGAASLAETENSTPAEALRKNVTSPGGTTEAALNILMDGRFQDVLDEALKAARHRGIELDD